MVRRYRDEGFIVNPGSIGLPRLRRGDQLLNPPWAEYGLVSYANKRLHIELRRTPLDVEAVVQAALTSEMPYAQQWAEGWSREQ
jgi:hypothetical protein